jgi:hypothetical protein
MNKERLIKLVEKLVWLADQRWGNFNLNNYLKLDTENKNNIREFIENPELINKALTKNHCNTTACVVGYLPVFFPEDFYYDNFGIRLFGYEDDSHMDNFYPSSKYFELEDDEWEYLFEPASYEDYELTDPLAVVKHIKILLESGIPEEFKCI